MNHSLSKHNLFTYLAGQANPLERQLVEEWLKNPDNAETFHSWLLEWEMRSLQFIPDQEAAFNKLTQRLEQVEEPEAGENLVPMRNSPFQLWGWKPYLAAATVLIVHWPCPKPLAKQIPVPNLSDDCRAGANHPARRWNRC
jgi:transmembrane sensor